MMEKLTEVEFISLWCCLNVRKRKILVEPDAQYVCVVVLNTRQDFFQVACFEPNVVAHSVQPHLCVEPLVGEHLKCFCLKWGCSRQQLQLSFVKPYLDRVCEGLWPSWPRPRRLHLRRWGRPPSGWTARPPGQSSTDCRPPSLHSFFWWQFTF